MYHIIPREFKNFQIDLLCLCFQIRSGQMGHDPGLEQNFSMKTL